MRNLVIVLIKALLVGELPDDAFQRHAAALNAVRSLHLGWADSILQKELTRIARTVTDERLGTVVAFVSYLQDSWQFIEDDVRGKVKRFIERLPAAQVTQYLPFALAYQPFQIEARARLGRTTIVELSALVAKAPQIELVDQAVERYVASDSYDSANTLGSRVIMPLVSVLTPGHIRALIEAAGRNSQINESRVLPDVLRAIRNAERLPPQRLTELIVKNGLGNRVPWLVEQAGGTETLA